jgi:hypothetical protein
MLNTFATAATKNALGHSFFAKSQKNKSYWGHKSKAQHEWLGPGD